MDQLVTGNKGKSFYKGCGHYDSIKGVTFFMDISHSDAILMQRWFVFTVLRASSDNDAES